MQVYIAGPMQGHPYFNFKAFFDAEAMLAYAGHNPVNPARHDMQVYPDIEQWEGFATGNLRLCDKFSRRDTLLWDLRQVAESDAIALLRGWGQSSGAVAEAALAKALGKKFALLYGNDIIWVDCQSVAIDAFVKLNQEENP